MQRRWLICLLIATANRGSSGQELAERRFYVPENASYTILQSACDSVEFTLNKTLKKDSRGHLASISSFVDPQGKVMGWHDFGNLEGPGWAANAVGGAHEIYLLGDFLQRPAWKRQAVSVLDHVLEGGFVEEETGFIRGYRETTSNTFCLNYSHHSAWFCPGSMAKIALQLLLFADDIESESVERATQMRAIATRCAEWIDRRIESVPNGWFPRRTTPDGKVYRKSPTGGSDPFWQTSADGLFIIQLQTELTSRGRADYRAAIANKVRVFMEAGGIFGSINHDTYDPHENVAYSVAFRTLLPASRLLKQESIRQFAYDRCLKGLEQFKMLEDRNGVATKGLLFMEKSWDTSYLWENAEAALAYFEAAVDLRNENAQLSRIHELDGLVILRAAAKHHYGPHGFLTEGVDWNDHVGQQHHIDGQKYGAIQYTEPFLNNQHIVEPTVYYLKHLAQRDQTTDGRQWKDLEANLLHTTK
jgi:hypothetical protein